MQTKSKIKINKIKYQKKEELNHLREETRRERERVRKSEEECQKTIYRRDAHTAEAVERETGGGERLLRGLTQWTGCSVVRVK